MSNPYRTTLRLMAYLRFQDPSSLLRGVVQSSRGVRVLRAMDGETSSYAVISVLFARLVGASAAAGGAGDGHQLTETQFKWFADKNPTLLVLLGTVPLFERWLLRLDRAGRGTSTVKVLSETEFAASLTETDVTLGQTSWGSALLESDNSRGLLLMSRLLWATREYSAFDPPPDASIGAEAAGAAGDGDGDGDSTDVDSDDDTAKAGKKGSKPASLEDGGFLESIKKMWQTCACTER